MGPFPITVDASADPDGLRLALRSTAPDGLCTSAAIYFGEQPALPLLEMYTKGITFRTGRATRAGDRARARAGRLGRHAPRAGDHQGAPLDDAADGLLELDWTKLVIARDLHS